MAISNAGSAYTNVNAACVLGSNSVTNVTIPTHDVAIVWFHFYDADSTRIINNSSSRPVLNGVTMTHIATQQDGTHNACQAFWCTGAGTGSGLTLSYTVTVNDITLGMGISLVFLNGVDTASPIRASATDADQNGASTSGAMSFSSGDWTMLGYTSDTALDQTNSGANTTLITQYQLTDTPYVGVVYKTDNGTISLPSSTNAYSAIVAMTVIPSGGGDVTLGLSGNAATVGRGTQTPGIEVPL